MNRHTAPTRKPSGKNLLHTVALAAMVAFVTISFPACVKQKTWATRDITDITVEAPYSFGPGPDVRGSLPQAVRDALEYFEVVDTGDASDPRITISRIAYKSGVQVSLDGATNGAMNGAMASLAKTAGDANPKFTSSSLTIDGLQARKATYTGSAKGSSIHLDGVFVQNGQKIWQVQVITTGDSSATDIARIVDSVHMKPEAIK
jgi:hypothetical protein